MEESSLYVPLNFWFNSNPGLALPLSYLPLSYHEVKIDLELAINIPYWKLRDYKNFVLDDSNNENLCDFIYNII